MVERPIKKSERLARAAQEGDRTEAQPSESSQNSIVQQPRPTSEPRERPSRDKDRKGKSGGRGKNDRREDFKPPVNPALARPPKPPKLGKTVEEPAPEVEETAIASEAEETAIATSVEAPVEALVETATDPEVTPTEPPAEPPVETTQVAVTEPEVLAEAPAEVTETVTEVTETPQASASEPSTVEARVETSHAADFEQSPEETPPESIAVTPPEPEVSLEEAPEAIAGAPDAQLEAEAPEAATAGQTTPEATPEQPIPQTTEVFGEEVPDASSGTPEVAGLEPEAQKDVTETAQNTEKDSEALSEAPVETSS